MNAHKEIIYYMKNYMKWSLLRMTSDTFNEINNFLYIPVQFVSMVIFVSAWWHMVTFKQIDNIDLY